MAVSTASASAGKSGGETQDSPGTSHRAAKTGQEEAGVAARAYTGPGRAFVDRLCDLYSYSSDGSVRLGTAEAEKWWAENIGDGTDPDMVKRSRSAGLSVGVYDAYRSETYESRDGYSGTQGVAIRAENGAPNVWDWGHEVVDGRGDHRWKKEWWLRR